MPGKTRLAFSNGYIVDTVNTLHLIWCINCQRCHLYCILVVCWGSLVISMSFYL